MATKAKINLLKVIPCRNEYTKTEQEGETVVLSFPRLRNSWIKRYLLPKSAVSEVQAQLDEHGTVVWNLIDGKRDVENIIENLADHFQNEKEYEARVMLFISKLQKDGFIKFIVRA